MTRELRVLAVTIGYVAFLLTYPESRAQDSAVVSKPLPHKNPPSAGNPENIHSQVEHGEVLPKHYQFKRSTPQKRAGIIAAYEDAERNATGAHKWQLSNNLATFQLEENAPEKAVRTLQSCEKAIDTSREVTETDRSRYFYNLATALEHADRRQEASSKYIKAAIKDQTFDSPLRSGLSLALTEFSKDWATRDFTTLMSLCLERGKLDVAGEFLAQSLDSAFWHAPGDKTAIPLILCQYLTAAKVSPHAFSDTWRKPIDKILLDENGVTKNRLQAIRRVYESLPFSQVADPIEALSQRRGYALSDGDMKMAIATADLLQSLGEMHRRIGAMEIAFRSYALAWTLDPHNIKAGVNLADMLLDQPDFLREHKDALPMVIAEFFEGKGGAYKDQDWLSILRYHTILGSIFEKLEQWGPENSSHTAAFQWEHAIRAYEKLKWMNPDEALQIPGAYVGLGKAMRGIGNYSEAWSNFLHASNIYVDLSDTSMALGAVDQALALADRASPPPEELKAARELRSTFDMR